MPENNSNHIKGLYIPESTSQKMIEDKRLRESVGALADVIVGMQEKVDSKLGINNSLKYKKTKEEY